MDGGLAESVEELSENKNSRWPESQTPPKVLKPLTDPEIVQSFLMGDHCLYGGTGWWKYEFCYGKIIF